MGHERGKDPPNEVVRHDLGGACNPLLAQILGDLRIEKRLLIIERLRIVDRTLYEL